MTKVGDIITTARGELDQIVGPDGNLIKLGLLAPSGPLPMMTQYEDVEGTLSDEELREMVTRSDRQIARERWDDKWIKDQDGRGACQGYGSASCVERVRDLGGQEFVELSGDAAYALVNGGRDRGSALSSGVKAAAEVGYPPASLVPRWEYRKSRIPQKAWSEASRFRGFEPMRVSTERGLYSALARGFVGVIAVHVSGRFSQLDRNGISLGRNGTGNHAVCADDIVWDAGIGEYKIDSPNSWKVRWGDNGRCYYTFDRQLRRTIQTHSFYVFRSATEDPEGDNPPAVITN